MAESDRVNQLRIIAGRWRGRKITIADQPDLRPTPDRVRETLFNWLQSDVAGSVCLDLFSGSGALGFEAFSRGASRVVMVDNSRDACETIQKNINAFDLGPLSATQIMQLENTSAESFLEQNKLTFNIVFLDPPYKSDILASICAQLERQQSLADNAKIYLEHDIKQSLPDLPENWHVLKSKKAGQVSYYLINRVQPIV